MDLDINNAVRQSRDSKTEEGFALWYLHQKPNFPEDFGDTLGYRVIYTLCNKFLGRLQWTRIVCV